MCTEQQLEIINSLKSNKSPGIDKIPAEFIKHCKMPLSEWLVHTFNYIIEGRDFRACGQKEYALQCSKADRKTLLKITVV